MPIRTSSWTLPAIKDGNATFYTAMRASLDAATAKFIACTSCIPTAVKVSTHDTISYFFQRGNGDVNRTISPLAGKCGA